MEFGNGFFGMDIEGMSKVAGSLDTEADHITTVLNQLSEALTTSPAWKGPDRDNFVKIWNGTFMPAMRIIVNDIRNTTTQVRHSIQVQINASRT